MVVLEEASGCDHEGEERKVRDFTDLHRTRKRGSYVLEGVRSLRKPLFLHSLTRLSRSSSESSMIFVHLLMFPGLTLP